MLTIDHEAVPVRMVRSARKTMALEIKMGPEIILRIPGRMAEQEARSFLARKQGWLEEKYRLMKQRTRMLEERKAERPEMADSPEHRNRARQLCEERVAYYAGLMGVTYGRISIRDQKTRWGSCSAKGNLNFNWKLALVPERLSDYVIVHELAHRREMNHSAAFWAEVERVLPDYRERRQELKKIVG